MLEHVPAWLGRALAGRRAGMDKIVVVQIVIHIQRRREI